MNPLLPHYLSRMSFKTRMVIFLLTIAITMLVAATAFVSRRAMEIIEVDPHARLISTHRLLTASVTLWLEPHIRAFHAYAVLPDMASMDTRRQTALLKSMAKAYPYMYLICTTDLSGKNIARSDKLPMMNYSSRNWFRQAKSGIPVTYESIISRTIRKPGIAVSMPILSTSNRVVGVAMFAMDLDNLSRQIRVSHIGQTGYAYVVDQRGRVIAHPDPTYADELRSLSTYPPVKAIRQGMRGKYLFLDEQGIEWHAYIDTLDNGWGIIVQQKSTEVLRAPRIFQETVIVIIILSIVVLIVTAQWAVKKSLYPIDILNHAVTTLTSETFSKSVLEKAREELQTVQARQDEIGSLADSVHKMAVQLEDTLASLHQESEQLRNMTWRLSEVEENERKKFSRELHDQIGHNLAILGINLNLLQNIIPADATQLVHSRMEDSLELVAQTTERIRNLMTDLRSPVLDDYGLVAAARLFGEQCAFRGGFKVEISAPESVPRLAPHVETVLFRIIQEAMTNIIKHARATLATVEFMVSKKSLRILIQDNGVGYVPAEHPHRHVHPGWGLMTIKERALSVGGSADITSVAGQGTRILVEVHL